MSQARVSGSGSWRSRIPRALTRTGALLLVALLFGCDGPRAQVDAALPPPDDAPPADDASPPAEDVSPSAEDTWPTEAGASDTSVTEAADASDPVDAGPPLRVLFVGNSYTSFNGLPTVVAALGRATRAAGMQVESVLSDGATLSNHWSSTGARERIAMGAFDSVVLQGQSLEPVTFAADFDQYAALFAGALREAKARGVWFSTWARSGAEAAPEVLTEALELRYRTAAAHNGDVVARVGAAWQIALLQLPAVKLYDTDGSHPSAAGTLLASCVIAQALMGETPRLPQPPPLGIAGDVAAKLCAIAEDGVRCNAGQSLCDDSCVTWNVNNCGACGNACAPGDPCRRGVCGCDPGLTGCSERCTNLRTDPNNCGVCGKTCPFGAVCKDGGCACPSTGHHRISAMGLAALYPTCTKWEGSLECNVAAHQLCATLGADLQCFTSGFGPPSGHAPTPEGVMCVAGVIHATSYTALRALVPSCDGVTERQGQNCTSAIHRYCVATGAVSGYGPIESAGDDLRVTCLGSATLVRTNAEELRKKVSRCTAADPITCSSAAWNFCAAMGHAAGFGPVEVVGDERDVVCVGP